MSSNVLPSFAGLGFDVTRTPIWDTTVQQSLSGMETRVSRTSYPRWKWELTYNVLRSGIAFGELQQLAGFFNARQGMFDTFLYQDADDNSVTSQQIALGDGTIKNFQLIRSFGGFIEPMLAPNISQPINVYLNGVRQTSGVSVTHWNGGTSQGPGIIVFTFAPTAGAIITADFGYYFPVRMSEDSVDFTLFLSQYYKVKKFSFVSVKN